MAPEYTERIKIDAFTDGIRDIETRRAVVLASKTTFEETIACALTIETVNKMIVPDVKIRRVGLELENYNSRNYNKSGNDWLPRKFWSGKGRIRCWICDKPGHISRDCWEIKRKRSMIPSSWYWRKMEDCKGSEEKERPVILQTINEKVDKERNLISSTMSGMTAIPVPRLTRGGDGLTLDGEINGRACMITLDTGAMRTIVRADLIENELDSIGGLKLQTATGESAEIKGKKEVAIRIGNRDFCHEVLVADIVDEVILGVDFMKKNKFVLDIGHATLNCGKIKLQLQLNNGEPIVRRITVRHSTEIRGEMENKITTDMLGVVKLNKEEQPVKRIRLPRNRVKPRYDIRGLKSKKEQSVWKRGLSSKLQPGWKRPYKVITKINDVIRRASEENQRLQIWKGWLSIEEGNWILFGTNRFGRRVVLRTRVTSLIE